MNSGDNKCIAIVQQESKITAGVLLVSGHNPL